MQKYIKKYAFILWLLGAVLLAIIIPDPAAKGGFFHTEITTNLGVWIIFLIQGLSLPTTELTSGYRPKRLHAFVLSWNYLLFPLVTGLLLFPLSLLFPEELRLGFWLLAILPTTVSSAITFTAVSGGNVSNAIFSTVLSNLISVLIVPTFALSYLAIETTSSISLIPLFAKLGILIILPLIIGQIVRQVSPVKATLIAKKTKLIGSGIIIFIVHAAFANSVTSGFLDGLALLSVISIIFSVLIVLLVISGLVWWSSGWFHLKRGQRVTAFFCASQKSLATGLPLATSILVAAPGFVDPAVVLIPLMCYHPFQLMFAGWLSGRFKGESYTVLSSR